MSRLLLLRRAAGPAKCVSRRIHTSKPPDIYPLNCSSEKGEPVPDQEWELRTGRAIYILQQTLPSFFQTGLITSVDKSTGAPKPPKSASPIHLPHIPLPSMESASTLDFLSSSASLSGTSSPNEGKKEDKGKDEAEDGDEEPIYSPNMRLEYTPPVALPAPFPKTFRLEGMSFSATSLSI